MIRVDLLTGAAERAPLPHFLFGLEAISLANLSWTDPALGVAGFGWWPVEDLSAPLAKYERYGDETLTADMARMVVVVDRAIVPWALEEIAAHATAEAQAAENDPANRMTVLGFRNRFTQAEKVAIEMAALDNPAGTLEQRTFAAGVRAMLADLNAAAYVNRMRPDTRAGVQQLEAAGIIAAGRAAAILDSPIQPHEAFKG